MAELIQTPAGEAVRLVDASEVARRLGVDREWVYAHASDLGAIRLGSQRGRLRFDLRQLEHHLSDRPQQPQARTRTARRRGRAMPSTGVELLPY